MKIRRPAKLSLLALLLVVLEFVAGCGGGGEEGSSVLMARFQGPEEVLMGLGVRVTNEAAGYDEEAPLSFSWRTQLAGIPVGTAVVSATHGVVTTDGEVLPTETTLEFEAGIAYGDVTDLEVFLLMWEPVAVGEYRAKMGADPTYGEWKVVGPEGAALTIEDDGTHVVTSPEGLRVERKADGTVEVVSVPTAPATTAP